MDEVIAKLKSAPAGLDDYTEYLEDVLDGVEASNDQSFFSAAFQFFEHHADADLGMPGPLVHFLEESYPVYIDPLCESVKRHPTPYTTWMVNRILNADLEDDVRHQLVTALESVAENPKASSQVKEEAAEYLEYQDE